MSDDPVQTLVARLKALGLPKRQIAKAADVDESTIRRSFTTGSMNAKTFFALNGALPELERMAQQAGHAA